MTNPSFPISCLSLCYGRFACRHCRSQAVSGSSAAIPVLSTSVQPRQRPKGSAPTTSFPLSTESGTTPWKPPRKTEVTRTKVCPRALKCYLIYENVLLAVLSSRYWNNEKKIIFVLCCSILQILESVSNPDFVSQLRNVDVVYPHQPDDWSGTFPRSGVLGLSSTAGGR